MYHPTIMATTLRAGTLRRDAFDSSRSRAAPCLPNPAPAFGPEPGFNEVSRVISSTEALERAVRWE